MIIVDSSNHRRNLMGEAIHLICCIGTTQIEIRHGDNQRAGRLGAVSFNTPISMT
jgi:hypothetical protein